MPIQVSRTTDGVFTVSLDHGDTIVETRDPWQMFRVIAHYFGMEHQTHSCKLCAMILDVLPPRK